MKTDTLTLLEENPDKLFWASFNRFELRVPGRCVLDCSHSGQCIDDIRHWVPEIQAQIEKDNFKLKPTPDKIREELKEYGAWDEAELADDAANFERMLWSACCDIREDDAPDCSDPVSEEAKG